MRVDHRLRILIALSVALLLPLNCAFAQDSNAIECEWLMSHLGESTSVSLGGKSLLLDSKTGKEIGDLRKKMSLLKEPQVVVYSPVVSAGRLVMLRFETQGAPRPTLVSVRETKWNTQTFTTALSAARQRGGDFFRRDLQRQMISDDAQQDLGKTIFLFDPESYGLVPTAFQLENSFILASPKIDQAVRNLSALRSHRIPPSEFVAVLGFPSDEAEYRGVFGDSKKFGELADWQQSKRDAETAITSHGIRVIGGSKEGPLTKAQLLHNLESQSGIIFIVAHADGARIILPGTTQPIDISPADIAALHLSKKPLVILRICQGEDHGFANAFVQAGASAVWANRGVIRADAAIQQIKSFLDGIGPTENPLVAIGRVLEHSQEAKASSALFTELHPLNGEGKNNAGYYFKH